MDENITDRYFEDLAARLCASYADGHAINLFEDFSLPHQKEIIRLCEHLMEVVFPGYREESDYAGGKLCIAIGRLLRGIQEELTHLITAAVRFERHDEKCRACGLAECADGKVRAFMTAIPEIREVMKKDVRAAYEGDPAAVSEDEVILSYPCIKTIAIQRFAHVLYEQKVPFVPRMMTEYAHSITGIDIHPGATLGEGVFIDHGTGVVIGETAVLGDGVKLYQGVTLGALSFPKDACGMIIKGMKRHPTIGKKVTIYAGATVLGDVTIGDGSVIGGNVWVTESLPPGSKVVMKREK